MQKAQYQYEWKGHGVEGRPQEGPWDPHGICRTSQEGNWWCSKEEVEGEKEKLNAERIEFHGDIYKAKHDLSAMLAEANDVIQKFTSSVTKSIVYSIIHIF